MFRVLETLDHGLIHSSLCLPISVSFVLLHFTTCIIFDKYASIYLKKQGDVSPCFHNVGLSHIDYCNSLLYGLPNNQFAKIQRVLNASARLVCSAPRFCHITPIMRDLHWLPIRASTPPCMSM